MNANSACLGFFNGIEFFASQLDSSNSSLSSLVKELTIAVALPKRKNPVLCMHHGRLVSDPSTSREGLTNTHTSRNSYRYRRRNRNSLGTPECGWERAFNQGNGYYVLRLWLSHLLSPADGGERAKPKSTQLANWEERSGNQLPVGRLQTVVSWQRFQPRSMPWCRRRDQLVVVLETERLRSVCDRVFSEIYPAQPAHKRGQIRGDTTFSRRVGANLRF